MAEDLSKLWNKRAKAFWKEAAIYWSYAGRSGLTAFLLLFVITGTYVYSKILQSTPLDYPYWRFTTPALALALGWSPIRTFLKPADVVFLTPAELKLRGYWVRSVAYSFLFQAAAALTALLLVWPLYSHCEGDHTVPFGQAALLLLAAKLMMTVSRFHESRLLFRLHRGAASGVRWLAALVIAFALFVQGPAAAGGGLLFAVAVMSVSLFLLPKHRIPWEFWIQKEARHQKNHYTFFSWFADVPKLHAAPKARMLLARQADRLPFSQGETYRYLYAKTFLRSEWFAILARITGLAVVLFLVVEHPVVESFIYAASVVMAAATVSSLEQSHRYSFWLELYPVPKSQRTGAITRTCLIALLSANTIMGGAFLIFQENHLLALAEAAAGFLYIWYYTRFPLRKKADRYMDE